MPRSHPHPHPHPHVHTLTRAHTHNHERTHVCPYNFYIHLTVLILTHTTHISQSGKATMVVPHGPSAVADIENQVHTCFCLCVCVHICIHSCKCNHICHTNIYVFMAFIYIASICFGICMCDMYTYISVFMYMNTYMYFRIHGSSTHSYDIPQHTFVYKLTLEKAPSSLSLSVSAPPPPEFRCGVASCRPL